MTPHTDGLVPVDTLQMRITFFHLLQSVRHESSAKFREERNRYQKQFNERALAAAGVTGR